MFNDKPVIRPCCLVRSCDFYTGGVHRERVSLNEFSMFARFHSDVSLIVNI